MGGGDVSAPQSQVDDVLRFRTAGHASPAQLEAAVAARLDHARRDSAHPFLVARRHGLVPGLVLDAVLGLGRAARRTETPRGARRGLARASGLATPGRVSLASDKGSRLALKSATAGAARSMRVRSPNAGTRVRDTWADGAAIAFDAKV